MELQVQTGEPQGSRTGTSPKQANYDMIVDYFNNKMTIGQFVEVGVKDASKASIKKHVVPKLDVTNCRVQLRVIKENGIVTKVGIYKREKKA